jgi:hypothetical protein
VGSAGWQNICGGFRFCQQERVVMEKIVVCFDIVAVSSRVCLSTTVDV